jgi:hypothetical protein
MQDAAAWLREMEIRVRMFIPAMANPPSLAPDSKVLAIESTIHL